MVFTGSKRVLVYEYMVNGSLESNHGIHHHELDWIGNSGYSLLHCSLYCDIKLCNVLFNANIMVEVADLSVRRYKIESHMSVRNARFPCSRDIVKNVWP